MTSLEEFHSTAQELWIENSFLYYYHNDNDQMIIVFMFYKMENMLNKKSNIKKEYIKSKIIHLIMFVIRIKF